jgi:endonuclease III
VADPRPARETREILDRLSTQHPGADTELHYHSPFELLIATILSAQSTDARVNIVTPSLFAKYPDARALAAASPSDVEPIIVTTGFFRAKTRSIIGAAQALVERHGGQVPSSMEALVELPGVGRKTANVVLGHALGVPGLPVDRHVLRVANRLGIATSENPEVVEKQLQKALPKQRWTVSSDTLILHGRRICRPKPMCDRCAARDLCRYYKTLGTPPPAGRSKRGAAPKKRAASSQRRRVK